MKRWLVGNSLDLHLPGRVAPLQALRLTSHPEAETGSAMPPILCASADLHSQHEGPVLPRPVVTEDGT